MANERAQPIEADSVEDGLRPLHKFDDGPGLLPTEGVLQEREEFFVRVELRVVGRDELEPRATRLYARLHGARMVESDVVEDENVTRPKSGGELVLDEREEALFVHGTIVGIPGDHSIGPHRREDGNVVRPRVRDDADCANAARRSGASRGHDKIDAAFIKIHNLLKDEILG
jgi:hypothetical protein